MELENGASFSIEALMENPGFRAWVLKEDQREGEYWKAYIAEHPERREVIEQARSLLLDMNEHFTTDDMNAAAVEQKLQAQLERLGSPEKLGRNSRFELRWTSGYLRLAAASILLLLVAGIAWWWIQRPSDLYATNFGEWETVTLPDGSRVNMNANTTLRLDDHWNDGAIRRVWLSGEAYFQVTKQSDTHGLFQVITDDLTVEVLGTAFNVHSRGEHTEVYLEEGSVNLELADGTQGAMQLEPGEMLTYSKALSTIVESGPASKELTTSWKDGLLKFDKTPMREVLQEVEDIYGITFRLEDESQYDRPITSQGVPMEQLEVTLPILARALGLTVELENDIYVIK
ncbi:FecR family protein [Flavilitoribacter nigricans]|uniref:Uncharacterized protein n=1 Tax=Flavilitoribacter nigricans (strain ATCC 23147 / DSM 23189 / NBRC 102662 / NCIMB 1420 / SS-2) TaxID=1122177 RepID=A0A2D0N4H7_FLAN2|nr:FecR domain-containing protein [Flavilitoribacter nigricans]PHN03421.1 hypothetical protein CRP01_27445 [Flavilitoribacter nigricans DSM 23189 = NBRC 102662]